MSETITMRHPTLPATQEIVVAKEAMPHYTAAGWQLVPDEELKRRTDEKAKAEADEAAETVPEPGEPEPAESTDRPARSRTKATKKDEES